MSKESIRERILSDARLEADLILAKAEEKGGEIIAEAMKLAEKERRDAELEMKEKAESIHETSALRKRRWSFLSSGALPFCTSAPQLSTE